MSQIMSADVISCEVTNSVLYEDCWHWDRVYYCLRAMDSPSQCQWPPTDTCCPRVTNIMQYRYYTFVRNYHTTMSQEVTEVR